RDDAGISRLRDEPVDCFLDHVLVRGRGEPPGDGAVARGGVGADERGERRGPHLVARVVAEGRAGELGGARTPELAQRRYACAPYLRRGVPQRGFERRGGARRG